MFRPTQQAAEIVEASGYLPAFSQGASECYLDRLLIFGLPPSVEGSEQDEYGQLRNLLGHGREDYTCVKP